MRSIDIHAHTFTPTMLKTLDAGQEWYGMRYNDEEKKSIFVREGKVVGIHPKCVYTPEERVADMDRLGTEVQVVAIHTPKLLPGSPACPPCPCRTWTRQSGNWTER